MAQANPASQPAFDPGRKTAVLAAPAAGYWVETWRRLRQRRLALAALGYVLFLSVVAAGAPVIVGTKPLVCQYKGKIYFPALAYFDDRWEPAIFTTDRFRGVYPRNLSRRDPKSWAVWPLIYQDPKRRVREGEWEGHKWPGPPTTPLGKEGRPNAHNVLGADAAGADVLARLAHGARRSLLVGFLSIGIAASIGVCVGALAGYFGGWIDIILSRVTEIIMCVPALVLILALIAALREPTIWHVMAVLGLTGWTGIARLTRGEFLRLKQTEFVTAARALGVGSGRIMFLHILRNALAPILVPLTFGVASAILTESALTFLGIVDASSQMSWGAVLNEGRSNFQVMWWLVIFPGIAIFLTVFAYNLIGEGLQEATDPRLREAAK